MRLYSLLLLTLVLLSCATGALAQVLVSAPLAPPPLLAYEQPLCPQPGYLWTPGYWAFAPDGYFWVPGTWVFPPQPGLLWTPGYWFFSNDAFWWQPGYWAPMVGYYGGINYGYGYPGDGYYGGYWQGDSFYYNQAVNSVSNAPYVYSKAVASNTTFNRVSYNGGPGGARARPTQEQLAAQQQRHFAATTEQVHHEQSARSDHSQFVSANHDHPAVAATQKPTALHNAAVPPASAKTQTNSAPSGRTGTNNAPASSTGIPEDDRTSSGRSVTTTPPRPVNPMPNPSAAREPTPYTNPQHQQETTKPNNAPHQRVPENRNTDRPSMPNVNTPPGQGAREPMMVPENRSIPPQPKGKEQEPPH